MKITCPVSAHLEEIQFTEDEVTGTILEVTGCTAHQGEGTPACQQLCIALLNLRRGSDPGPTRDEVPTRDEPTRDEEPTSTSTRPPSAGG